jgi:hypothetical protein
MKELPVLRANGTGEVIMLDGSPDLTPHLPAGVEYLRVEVLNFAAFVGE